MFSKLFSLGGTFSRKEYLLYGLITPIVIFSLLSSIASLFNKEINKAKKLAKSSIVGAEKTNNQMALLNAYLVYSAVMEEVGNNNEADTFYEKAEQVGLKIGMTFEEEEGTDVSAFDMLKSMFKKDNS